MSEIEFGIPFYLSKGKKSKVKQFFADYNTWEDYKNGMYLNQNHSTIEIDINNAKKLLSTPLFFSETIDELFNNWGVATKVNLTNINCNKRAWVGAAACSFKFNIPEVVTRSAWSKLTFTEQKKANKIAQLKINNWTLEYKNKNYAKTQIRIECF